MNHTTIANITAAISCFAAMSWSLYADNRAPLVFHEDFKEIPPATPITQEHIAAEGLQLSLHGPSAGQVKKSHHKNKPSDPWYVWSGQCKDTWALSLRPAAYRIDLSGEGAAFRWRTKQQGGHKLRILIQCFPGNWFVSDQFSTDTPDWTEAEFVVANLTWKALDITNMAIIESTTAPELDSVEAIGFTDLQAGRGSGACSRLDWIEVRGGKVEIALETPARDNTE